nr:MAG TPA: hypothetical protein [Caudoviricetes sp.]
MMFGHSFFIRNQSIRLTYCVKYFISSKFY